jgi:beta-lactamase regulating signal transducer with metallopeptidase domain
MTTERIWILMNWIFSASWKGTVLILLVGALLWMARERIPARWRYALWLVVLVRLAIPVAPASSVSLFNLLDSPAGRITAVELRRPVPEGVALPRIHAAPHTAELWWPGGEVTRLARMVGWIWLSGFALLALRLAGASIQLHRQLRRERPPVIAPAVVQLLRACGREMGIRRAVLIRETELVRSPALHGMVRPVLLLPAGVMEGFTSEELRFVFLHELAHLKRSDVLFNWAISLVQMAHWFNPLVWLATLRMREERELACDELALSCLQQEERPGYGRTILKILDRFRTPAPVPALLGILNDKSQMKRRILMITRFRTHQSSSLLFGAVVLALAAVSLTDARAGQRIRMALPHDPAARATMEKLHQSVSLDLTEANLSTVLAEITSRTGVLITPSAAVPAEAWQKKITIDADQVPAHVVLIESLAALGVGFEMTAEGVTLGKGSGVKRVMLHAGHGKSGVTRERKIRRHPASVPEEVEQIEIETEIEIETNGTEAEAEKVIEILESDLPPMEHAPERVFVRKVMPGDHEVLEDGTVRRNITLRRIDNGVETRGTLRLEIRPAS